MIQFENSVLVPSTVEVNFDRIDDLVTGAVEGGSKHWIGETKIIGGMEGKEGYSFVNLLREGVKILFVNNKDGSSAYLTLERMFNALLIMANSKISFHHWGNILTEKEDGKTSDIFLQLALFGEIVYG